MADTRHFPTFKLALDRRHFVGVQGARHDKGELWGAVNLFKWREPSHGSVDSGRLIEKRDARNVMSNAFFSLCVLHHYTS
jgi:hypothetical protein